MKLYNPYSNPLFSEYNNNFYCRNILVDSEPKVIENYNKLNTIKKRNIILDNSGRANNWALGYNDCNNNKKNTLYNRTIEVLRHEIEETDFVKGIVLIYSTGGGTGSGLGSRILKECKNEFNELYLLPIVIHPSWNGDTPLQYYNTIMAWNTINEYADNCIYFENDYLMNIALNQKEWKKSVSINNINSIIASNLSGLFFPTIIKNNYFNQFDWSLFFYNLTPISSMKYMELFSYPIQNINGLNITKMNNITQTWSNINQNLLNLIYKYRNKKDLLYSISMYNNIRGNKLNDYNRYENEILLKITRSMNFLGINDEISETISNEGIKSSGMNKNITTCIHRNSICESMKYCLYKSTLMFDAKAYLHWYNKYGLNNDDLSDSFNTIHNIINEYNSFKIF